MSADQIEEFVEETLPILADEGPAQNAGSLAQDWGLDIEKQVYLMEKAVEFGNRLVKARNTLIRMFTYAQDWKCFGHGEQAKACLSAAGALRVVDKADFPIKYHDITEKKKDILDEHGKVVGYRYEFSGFASMHNRTVHATGAFGTRDPFLGKRGDDWKDPMEINEGHIRQAAHTYFKGNAAKDLLGLKNMPWDEYEQLTRAAGQDVTKTTSVTHRQGSKGGVSADQRRHQDELWEMLRELACHPLVIVYDKENDEKQIVPPSPEQLKYIDENPDLDAVEILQKISLRGMSSFKIKSGKNKGDVFEGHTDLRRLTEKQAPMIKSQIKKLMEQAGLC
jgi:hypothetical protein